MLFRSKEMARLKTMILARPARRDDASQGRALFAKTCQQCHTLFGTGGKVGPDITGSNRADLDYLLHNILDPSAEIPNDYRPFIVDTDDDRNITGILKRQDEKTVTFATQNETITLPRNQIKTMRQSELSMMPEGLLAQMSNDDVANLIAYLRGTAQVTLAATADNISSLFNGKDLTGWDGDPAHWSVENGEIVGKSPGLKRNEFLRSQMSFGDFRLTVKVKLTPNKGNSGIQFRSEALPDGEVRGYQADIGVGWWGKIYEERGRGLIWKESGESAVKVDDWNTYEIVAHGSHVRTSINGKPCADVEDTAAAQRGIIAFQLHAGGPFEVRYKDLKVELNPKPDLVSTR